MPEPYWPKRKGSFTLSDVHKVDSLVRIKCRYCKRERNYLPGDLKTVFGNIEVDDVPFQMRCSDCRRPRTLEVDLFSPSPAERQSLTIRRVHKIGYVRRVTWLDVEGG